MNNHNNCPICKKTFEYKTNKEKENLLSQIKTKCPFVNNGCKEIIFYSDFNNHAKNCKYNDSLYECKVDKYFKNNMEFKKCCYKAKKERIENHFKICGLSLYKCIFCNEAILSLNFRDHFLNKCKVRLTTINGDTYIGEFKNNRMNGYGIKITQNNDYYIGEFENNKINGYGIFILDNDQGGIEGDWKNNSLTGYGILIKNNTIYKGEYKNGKREGYGIIRIDTEEEYKGEWKNNKQCGYGIFTNIFG